MSEISLVKDAGATEAAAQFSNTPPEPIEHSIMLLLAAVDDVLVM